jgi:hypothetical protein
MLARKALVVGWFLLASLTIVAVAYHQPPIVAVITAWSGGVVSANLFRFWREGK